MSRFRQGSRRRIATGVLAAAILAIAGLSPAALAQSPTGSQYCDGLGSSGSGTGAGTDCATGGTANATDEGGTDPASAGGDPSAVSDPAVAGDPGNSGLGTQVGSLPFTGWDLVSLSAIALALMATGLALSRWNHGRAPRT